MNNVVNRALAAKKKIFTLLFALMASVILQAGVTAERFAAGKAIGILQEARTSVNNTSDLNSLVLPQRARMKKAYAADNIVNNLSFDLNVSTHTAEVIGCAEGATIADIPVSIEHNNETFTVTSIGDSAFYNCTTLTSVIIPNSIINIGTAAFSYCNGLTSVTIPESVQTTEKWPFYGCSSIKSVVWNAINCTTYNDGQFVYPPFQWCENITSFTIGEKVETLPRGLCYALPISEITIPNKVTSIGTSAFRQCLNLTSVTIGNGVTSIESSAFRECTNLTSINIPNCVTNIGSYAFHQCSNLPSINIPTSLTKIEYAAFAECSKLSAVTIPNNITDIGTYAFYNCIGLTSVSMGNNVTRIGFGAFYGCNGLTSVTIPNSVTNIETRAFQRCENLTNINIPTSLTKIECGVFAECSKLSAITIPSSVTSIDTCAFMNCSNLANIYLPNSLTKIEYGAFAGCNTLSTITIPNSVTSIGVGAFTECAGLTSISVEANNPNYCSVDGVLFNKDKTTLMQYPAGKLETSYTIPGNVTSIGSYAFSKCTGLTLVTIPNSVTSIGDGVFEDCTVLKSIVCEAVTPPTCGTDAFENVSRSIPLYVPSNSVSTYKTTSPWSEWKNNIMPTQAEETAVTEPQAKPTGNSAVVDWPKANNAVVYIIIIKKGNELICMLSFNAQGQLLSISFAAPARNGNSRQTPVATQTSTGWQYTISGLDPDTEYSYTVIAKRSDDSEVYNTTVPFKTQDEATGISTIIDDESSTTNKVFRDGQILILRGEKVYTITGQEVK